GPGAFYYNARFSPDGRWLTFERRYSSSGTQYAAIWLVDLNAQLPTARVLIDGPGTSDISPAWSPDGTRLAFSSNRDGGQNIYVTTLPLSGDVLSAGPATRLTSSRNLAKVWPTWSPDNAQVAYFYSQQSWFKLGKVVLGNATEYAITDG